MTIQVHIQPYWRGLLVSSEFLQIELSIFEADQEKQIGSVILKKKTFQTIMWSLISDIYRKPTVDCLHNLLFSTKFAQSMKGYVGFASSNELASNFSVHHHILHLTCSPSYLSFKYWTCYSENSIFSCFEAVSPKILLILYMIQVLLSWAFWNRHLPT